MLKHQLIVGYSQYNLNTLIFDYHSYCTYIHYTFTNQLGKDGRCWPCGFGALQTNFTVWFYVFAVCMVHGKLPKKQLKNHGFLWFNPLETENGTVNISQPKTANQVRPLIFTAGSCPCGNIKHLGK